MASTPDNLITLPPERPRHDWVAKDGSIIKLLAGSYHVRYVVLNDRDGTRVAFGSLVTDDEGEDVVVELEPFNAEDRDHPNYRSYARWTGENRPW